MPGPRPDELVFGMSNNVKTNVQFRMRNKHNKFVRGLAKLLPNSKLKRKLRAKVAVRQPEAELAGWEGICGALSCMYLRRSHELGNVTSRDQVDGNLFKLTIAQAAYEKATSEAGSSNGSDVERMLDAMGMRVSARWADDDTTVQELFDQVCGNAGRYLALVFFPRGGAHFIGIRNGGGVFFLFEPEEGLYRFDAQDRFEDALGCHLVNSGLQADSAAWFWETQLD